MRKSYRGCSDADVQLSGGNVILLLLDAERSKQSLIELGNK